MPSSLDRRPARPGYTLLEMLIVVAVVLVVVSVSWPAMRRPAAKSKLRDAAKQLRVALARARLEAIRSGTGQQFRYQPGTGYFEISASAASEGGGFVPVAFEEMDEGQSSADAFAAGAPVQYELPDGVRFFDPSAPVVPPGEPDPIASPGNGSWSTPILFYPNGRSFNARIRLHGQYGYYVDVVLRGLTGAGKVGKVERLEEPLEGSSQAVAEEPL